MVLLHSVAGGCCLGAASRVGAVQFSPLRVLCGFLGGLRRVVVKSCGVALPGSSTLSVDRLASCRGLLSHFVGRHSRRFAE
eukprot:12078575-Alexandrium_andersonii.AAC.1